MKNHSQVAHFFRVHIKHSPRWAIFIDHNTNLNKFENIQVPQNMFSDHSKIKLEINNRKISGKVLSIWKINNTLLNIAWVKEKLKETLESTVN